MKTFTDKYEKFVVTNSCNNECFFCKNDSVPIDTNSNYEVVLSKVQRLSAKSILLTGGDAYLSKNFIELVSLLFGLKKDIAIESNGRFLSNSSQVDFLKEKINHIRVSLHGNKKSLNTYLTNIEESFFETVNGIKLAQENGIVVYLQTLVNRSNFRNLSGIVKFVEKYKIKKWFLQYPQEMGRLQSIQYETFLPPTELVIVYLKKLVRQLDGSKCELIFQNFPSEIMKKIGPSDNISVYYIEQ